MNLSRKKLRLAEKARYVGILPHRLALVFTLMLAWSAPASAQHLRVFLQLDDAACVDADDLEDAVEERVDHRVFADEDDAELWLLGEERGFSATLELLPPEGASLGMRTIDAQSCEELSESLALIVALIVDAPSTRTAIEESTPPLDVRIEAVGLVTFRLAPGLAGGVGAAVHLARRAFGLRIEAFGLLPSNDDVRTWGLGLVTQVCPRLVHKTTVEWSLCAGGEAMLLSVQGRAVDERLSATRPLLNVRAGTRLAFFAGPVVVGLGIGGGLALIRDRFVVTQPDGSTELSHRTDLLSARFDLSVGAGF